MAAGDLTTLAAVQAWMPAVTNPSQATLAKLQQLITAISAFVPGVIQRGILTAQYVEVRNGNGKDRMQLRNWPVQSIAMVEWFGTQLTTSVDLMSTSSGIATDGRSLILVGSRMPYGQPIRITYTAGWDVPPTDISDAVNELVAEEYGRSSRIGEVSHSSSGATTVSFSQKAMHDAITAKLKNYMAVAPLC